MISLEPEKNVGSQFTAANRSRSTVYGFLSKVYEREITVDFLRHLTGNDFIAQIDSMNEDEGFRLLSTYLKDLAGRDLEQVRLGLAVDYAALFLGLGGGVHHPSESAYRSSTHFIMQQPRDDVLASYRTAYVDKVKDFPEPEDHIAMELQFMAHLSGKTAEAMQAGKKDEAKVLLETQKDFINNHLLVWVPKFTEDVMKAAKLDFYRAVAKITGRFIELDKEAVSDLAHELDHA